MTMRISLVLLLVLVIQPLRAEDEAGLVAELIEQANAAAAANNHSQLLEINQAISSMHEQIPDWVESGLAAAGGYDETQVDAIEAWQELTAEAQQSVSAGDFGAAIAAQESALLLAQDAFGAEHWASIASSRDLGFIYRQVGAAEEAEAYYSDALSGAENVLGDEHPQTLEIYSLLAELFAAGGLAEEAFSIRELVATNFASALGEHHLYTVSARASTVDSLAQLGQYDAAVAENLDLCSDVQRDYGDFHPQHIGCLGALANLLATSGDFATAEATHLQISGLMGKATPTVDDSVLNNLAQLAEVYRQQGKYRESGDLLSGVIQLALQTGNVEAGYTARSYLGRVLNNRGEFEKARLVTEDVLDYGLQNWLDRPLNIYNTLLELGGIYQAQGQLADAQATFEEALAGLSESVGDLHPSTLVATNNLGQIYEQVGLYDEAEPVLELALARFEQVFGEAHPDALRARNNLALLHESQGNFREAEPLYLKSLDLMREVHGEVYTDTIAVKNNLAFLYMLMEEHETAANTFAEVATAWEQMFGPDHQNTLKAKNNLGRAYQKLNRLDEAEVLLVATLAGRARVLGENHPDVIRSMIDLGNLRLEQGNLPEAESLLTEALSRADAVLAEQHPYTFEALNSLSRVKRAMGQLQAAIALRRTGLQRRTVFLDRMLWTTGDNAREGYMRLHKPELDEFLAMLVEDGDMNRGKQVIDASLARKGLLLKVTSEIQQIASLSQQPALRSIAEELESARQQLAALTLSGPTIETGDRHAVILYELEQRVNNLQGQLGRASVRYRTSIAQVSSDTLEGALKDNTAVVDFLAYDNAGQAKLLAGVMIKRDGEVTYGLVDYPSRADIEKAIIDYRTYIQDDLADEDEIREFGQIAHTAIWQPLENALGDIEYVYVVPDGALNILPFNALLDQDENYLIQTHDLHLLTSARDLLPNQYTLAQGNFLIVAGPDYDSEAVVPEEELDAAKQRRSSAMQLGIRGAGTGLRGLNFAPLPGATEEGRIINEQVENSNEPSMVFFGEDAQEQVLAEVNQPPEILHVATHGFFLEADDNLRRRLLKLQRGGEQHIPPPGDNPLLRAGLAFAGVNTNARFLGDIDTRNDGVLTALEVLDLDLSGTQLVVLSACETGLGEVHEGEGVYGLRRSFQEAGVAEVISSLWEVSDAGTQALMTDFYARLLDGVPAREALRDAQLELMESPQWGYPYVWSAFMIVGSYESAGFRVQ